MRVEFALTGTQPILFHADDVESSDELKVWRQDERNKNISVAGDDRSPAWTWQTYLYSDGEHLAIPMDAIMACLRMAGAKLIMKKQKTFKEATQSGIVPASEFCVFTTEGKQIPMAAIGKLRDMVFAEQAEAAKGMGFRLFVKRAKVGQTKHVRVRARFDTWEASGELFVDEMVPELTFSALSKIFDIAGRIGLLDWRPGSPRSPGPYGMFTAKVKKVG